MPLLRHRLAYVELAGLTIMVGEAFRPQADLLTLFFRGKVTIAACWRLARAFPKGVGLIVRPSDRVAHGHVPVLLEMREGTFRRVNRQVGEVRPTETLQLRVEIGEIPALQQRIVA